MLGRGVPFRAGSTRRCMKLTDSRRFRASSFDDSLVTHPDVIELLKDLGVADKHIRRGDDPLSSVVVSLSQLF